MITFFGMPSRSSGKIRGLQISKIVGGNFFDKNSVNVATNINQINNNCVFIRDINIGHANYLKSKGRTIAYDLLDRPVADLHVQQRSNIDIVEIDWKKYVKDCIDVFIVNNKNCRDKLLDVIMPHQKIVIIPHHIIRGNEVSRNTKKEVKNIGYLGTFDQLHDQKKISEFCKNLGLNLLISNASERKDCIDFLKNLDIGLIYLNRNDRTDYVLKYKPNTKLTNFQSFGIPSICCNYSSFHEFAPQESFKSANNLKELFDAIHEIVNNNQRRNDIIESGIENAKRFTVDNIAKMYVDAFKK